ncbi:hypothetical protein NLU13_2169 [Sarocladium strictum]|uniref:HMA domain-containing protein n=1 Tax=Sarocladium strictum TaxID=5046 RepID=A0AA39LD71_SARSR|nr:hypothetical protein NLU13_2169 [Sarocladium strictum]
MRNAGAVVLNMTLSWTTNPPLIPLGWRTDNSTPTSPHTKDRKPRSLPIQVLKPVAVTILTMSPGCCSSRSPASATPPASAPEPVGSCCGSDQKTAEKISCCTEEKEQCDEKCIDIAAGLVADRSSPEVGRAITFSAARDKYRELLNKAHCICLSVLEDVSVTCCATKNARQPVSDPLKPKDSVEERISIGKSSSVALFDKTPCADSCCETEGIAASASAGCSRRNVKPQTTKTSCGKTSKDPCCDVKVPQHGCCSPEPAFDVPRRDPCRSSSEVPPSGCCSAKPAVHESKKVTCCDDELPTDGCCSSGSTDVRQGALADRTDRSLPRDGGGGALSMSVEGMTCNDCAVKLGSSLKTFEGTSDVRVNFIRGRADLRYDPTITSAEEIIQKARTATGFRITEVRQGHKGFLDLLVESHAAALESLRIDGLLDVTRRDKATVRVSYEPEVIGARDLVERIGPLSTGLAPAVPEPVGKGRGQFRLLGIYTAIATALTLPVVTLAWAEDLVSDKTQAIVSLPLATAVQLIAVPVFYKPALRSLILHHALELDMLVVVSITAAFAYSLVAFGYRMASSPLETGEFFETSTLLITLVMMGRLLASYARIRAVAAVSLRSHHAASAILVEGVNEDVEIDARLLQYGDTIKVLPHSLVPTDGVVIRGISEVDESMLTGESLPVPKDVGSDLIAGTLNHSGVLVMRLTRLPGDNTVMDIARLVEDATNSKPRIQDLADRIAGYFLPVIGIAALICFAIWIAIGIQVRNYSTGRAISNAVTYAIAVLAVSCPCALGLAVPMVLVVAGGIAARGGVIIKSAESTERARKVTDVVFDKTGTITESGLRVVAEECLDDQDETCAIVRQLLSGSSHPVSISVLKHLDHNASNASKSITLESTKSIPGSGIEARVEEELIRAGNPEWTGHSDSEPVRRFAAQGLSILTVSRNGNLTAVYGLKSRIRSTAQRIIGQLKDNGITVHLVSGDRPQAVEAVAKAVGINTSCAVGSHTPEEKRDYVARLMDEGKYVLFCGDGTNDAVAVAQANVGVQISEPGSASAVTQSAADVILLSGLPGLPLLLDVSRAAFRRIVFNFVWSATYNVLAILLAGGAFVKIRIAPAYAGAGEMVSILPVIVAAMTMLLVKLKP